jgi:hypothetical protein
MIDDSSTTLEEKFSFTSDDVRMWVEDNDILEEVRKHFSRLKREKAKDALTYLLRSQGFKASDISDNPKTFLRHNWKLFNISEDMLNNVGVDAEIKVSDFQRIRKELLQGIRAILEERSKFDVGEGGDGQRLATYYVKKFVPFETIRKMMCDEAGKVEFVYNFESTDVEAHDVNEGSRFQRCFIQILSQSTKFEYPLIFKYFCPNCENVTFKKAYEVVGMNTKLICPHSYAYMNAAGETKNRVCKTMVSPDKDLTITYPAFFYEIGYEIKGRKLVANAFAFKDYTPGYYECVLYRVPNVGRTEMFVIIDVKQVPPSTLALPQQREDENYLFTLQRTFDEYIEEKAGIEIYGLYPIKCSLIIQSLLAILNERLLLNVMVVGDPSTGKSMLLKYYPFLLSNYYNMSTNGLSVSVAGLRGTRSNITLFGRDVKIVTVGHLGTFRSIHIDEAGENKELVQNLKSFLLEDNYSYDKAGSLGITNRRMAHINISQNLDYEHVGQYRGAIRKAYKDLNMTIGGVEKEDWDEEWDLFQPLHKYDNPQLRKVIREKRLEFKQKQVFWIDGLDYPLHERFPFYFYLVTEKTCHELDEAVKRNATRKSLTENLEVIRALYTEDVESFYKTLIQYRFSSEDGNAYRKVDKIIEQYGYTFDARIKNIYYMIVRLSRIINQRYEYKEMDYELVKWYLETTNTKLDLVDAATYNIKGPPNVGGEEVKDKVEEDSRSNDDMFKLPDGEFF